MLRGPWQLNNHDSILFHILLDMSNDLGSITVVVTQRIRTRKNSDLEARMSTPRQHRLGDLQLKIMKVLWDQNSTSVPPVHEALRSEQLAYTTVATMLRKMEARGLVNHTEENRRFIYRARVTADEVTQSMSHDMVDRLFQGSLADMVNHLLETREVSREELLKLEQLIAQKKRKL